MALPVVLLEHTFGWLVDREVQAAKTVCRTWSPCRAARRHCAGLPCASLVNLVLVETLAMTPTVRSHPGLVDLTGLPRLRSASLVLHGSGVPFDILVSFQGPFAQFVQHVDFACYPLFQKILFQLLVLPHLQSLVLRNFDCFRRVDSRRAQVTAPVERLVLVDCDCVMDLAFTERLTRLRSVSFVHTARAPSRCVLPMALPGCVQERVQELTLDLVSMQRYRGRSGYYAVDLSGFTGLRRLRLQSSEKNLAAAMNILSEEIMDMDSLQSLELYTYFPAADHLVVTLRLTCLDISLADFLESDLDWSAAASASSLRSLVLRDVAFRCEEDQARFRAWSSFALLRDLMLVGYPVEREFPAELVPAQLESLQLVGFWPSGPLHVRDVWLERGSFVRMTPEDQRQLRASVKNLYVVSSLRKYSSFS